MDSAQTLFATLSTFKSSTDGRSPQQLFLEYCRDVLGTVERLHFDYKGKTDPRTAQPGDPDKRNLAKAISGFANSSGGVLIWGIDEKDGKITLEPISNVEEFTASLARLAAQMTDPPVQGTDVAWLPADAQNERGGFTLIYIPESPLPPHRVILKDREITNHYYLRSGESFVVATHTQLEDMFGRRPRPVLALRARPEVHSTTGQPIRLYSVTVVLEIVNEGRGAAHAPLLALRVHSPYKIDHFGLDGNGKTGLKPLVASARIEEHLYGADTSVVIHAGTVYPVTAVRAEIALNALRSMDELVIDWRIAAEGIQPVTGRVAVTFLDFANAIKDWIP